MGGMPSSELVVTCLCAEWCDVCREYRPRFQALAGRFPGVKFAWLDIEDDAEEVGELEIENFPTIRIMRGGEQLFYGVMLPQPGQLARVLEKLFFENKPT
jgi:thiol-disulfide isomerase/thioredoxin